ncbi:MAG: hypothetical protein ACLFO6_03930 [Archaeoglobaceae archaeon]
MKMSARTVVKKEGLRNNSATFAFYFFWVLGLIVSTYLMYINYFSYACPIGMECTTYPPALGFAWFAVAPIALKWRNTKIGWQIAGLGGIVVLEAIEFTSGYYCAFCTAAHICGLIMILLTVKYSF